MLGVAAAARAAPALAPPGPATPLGVPAVARDALLLPPLLLACCCRCCSTFSCAALGRGSCCSRRWEPSGSRVFI